MTAVTSILPVQLLLLPTDVSVFFFNLCSLHYRYLVQRALLETNLFPRPLSSSFNIGRKRSLETRLIRNLTHTAKRVLTFPQTILNLLLICDGISIGI